jgi:hypothetical protein
VKKILCLAVGAVSIVAAGSGRAASDSAALAAQMKEAKVPLERGLSASAGKGKPISAKYELEEGKLQLSVYTAKGSDFFEVIVDHRTGKIAKAEPITGADDLTAAKSQAEAMSSAKSSLQAAVEKALKANKGYRAVSVEPSMKGGHPNADVKLLKGSDEKTVTERLD